MRIYYRLIKKIDFTACFLKSLKRAPNEKNIYPPFYPHNTHWQAGFLYLAALCLIFPMELWAKPRLIWIGNASLLGGKYQHISDEETSGWLAALTVSPVVAFGEKGTLFPIYLGNYKSFGDVLDVAGGATAFKATQEHQAILKWSQKFPQGTWALKPFISGKIENFKEVNTDRWGKGLFDQNRYGTGVTVTYRTKPKGPAFHSLNLGYSFYYNEFPNFRSRSSRFEGELESRSAGVKILDNQADYIEFKAEHRLSEKWRAENGVIYARRRFKDQRVIENPGLFIPDERTDNEIRFETGATYLFGSSKAKRTPHLNRRLNLEANYQVRRSNQNHFDTTRLFFTPHYYDFVQKGLIVNGQWAFSRLPIQVSLKYNYEVRDYRTRLVQDAFGTHDNETISQWTHLWTANVSYQLGKGFSVRFLRNQRRTKSNTHYERFYRYNFTTSNYLIGVSYEF